MGVTIAVNPSFWDGIAERYAKKPVRDEAAYQRTLERVRAHLTSTDRVLELGCGTGSTALRLAPHARHILATDCSPKMIEIAQSKASAQGTENVSFSTAAVTDVTLDPGSFDVVMSFNLLHLLPDVPAALERIRALLAPGGLFVSKTPCIGDHGLYVRAVIPVMQFFGRAPFVNFVTQRGLERDITAAGFAIIETGLYPARSRSFFVVGRKSEPRS